jgi:Linalool dehydratase/isomerase
MSPLSGIAYLRIIRYQLATMAYAAGASHYHTLPAMREAFKELFEKLIAKMMRREVWGYWYLTSQSGKFVDPSIEELRKPWADPVRKENIMVSFDTFSLIVSYSFCLDCFNSLRWSLSSFSP